MNRKKLTALTLAAALALSLSACGESAASPASSAPAEMPEAGDLAGEEAALFSSLGGLEFRCDLGGGVTRLTIQPDGSFSGTYRRDETGGWAGTIHGVQYRCDFTGQFTAPQQVNEYTYSVQIDRLDYAQKPGSSGGIVDGIKYYYCNAYELENGEDILIYLPGAPTAELPEGFLDWVMGSDDTAEEELPFYALNNAVHQQGFSSYDRLESIRDSLEWMEDSAASIKTELTGGTLTQAEQEEWADSLAELWGGALDDLWGCLEQRLDPAELEPLAVEQTAWISWKEEQVTQAGAGLHEGYSQAAAEDMAAAELTRDRVYELLDWLGET